MINKDELKNNLSIEDVYDLLVEFGGEPVIRNGLIISKTICHNHKDDECSHKLYYYDNTHLFKCYTGCSESNGFDIYQLIQKIKKIEGLEFSLPQAIHFVAEYFNIALEFEEEGFAISRLKDWEIFKGYKKENYEPKKNYEYAVINKSILQFLPKPKIKLWEDEGISDIVMKYFGICYDPVFGGIVIPHYNSNGELIGIRERTLIEEQEVYGKYKPAIINGKMYNHPLGYNLYGLNFCKENVKLIKKVIVFEAEKSVMKYASYFGIENNIAVAACGSSFSIYQLKELLALGVQEVIIAFDRESEEKNKAQWVQKFYNIHEKYGKYVQISFIYDKEGETLKLKDSPIDEGPEVFMELFQNRITL